MCSSIIVFPFFEEFSGPCSETLCLPHTDCSFDYVLPIDFFLFAEASKAQVWEDRMKTTEKTMS